MQDAFSQVKRGTAHRSPQITSFILISSTTCLNYLYIELLFSILFEEKNMPISFINKIIIIDYKQ